MRRSGTWRQAWRSGSCWTSSFRRSSLSRPDGLSPLGIVTDAACLPGGNDDVEDVNGRPGFWNEAEELLDSLALEMPVGRRHHHHDFRVERGEHVGEHEAVYGARHPHVREYVREPIRLPLDHAEGYVGGCRLGDRIACAGKDLGGHHADQGLVVDDEDARRIARRTSAGTQGGGSPCRIVSGGLHAFFQSYAASGGAEWDVDAQSKVRLRTPRGQQGWCVTW